MNQNYKEFLASYTKSDLTEIRQYWNFSGISQLNKAELVDVLDQKIKESLREWLSYQSSKEVGFLKKLIKEQQQKDWITITPKDILAPALNNFQGHGIIGINDTETEKSVRIPAGLSAEIAKIITDSGFQDQIKNNDRLLQFAWGLLAYYGALSIMQLIEFYDFYFELETEAEKFHHFFQEMNEFHNNTRLRVLKGHTPNEMMKEELDILPARSYRHERGFLKRNFHRNSLLYYEMIVSILGHRGRHEVVE